MTYTAEAADPPQPLRKRSRPRADVFVIFEGGGAKGVAHVGAMDALYHHGLNVVGAAGTSAGALAAVLTALGYEGRDVMTPDKPEDNILQRNGLTPVKLLGETAWRRVSRLKTMRDEWGPPALIGGGLGLLAYPKHLWSLWKIYDDGGLFDTTQIQAFVNHVIRYRLLQIKAEAPASLKLPEVPEKVTFEEFVDGRWPTIVPLKIVAANVDTKTLELFDAINTPKVVVAEAVAASISIPIAFKPAKIPSYPEKRGRYVDGGIVSNFPTWVFMDEKLALEREHQTSVPIPIVGFRLRCTKAPEKRSAAEEYLGNLLEGSLSGGQGVASRSLDDILVIPLDVPLDTMDFDLTPAAYGAARNSGFESADRHLTHHFNDKPKIIRDSLKRLRRNALKLINTARKGEGRPEIDQLRVCLIQPVRKHSLRVVASVGMETDADDRLWLDVRGDAAAKALLDKRVRIYDPVNRRGSANDFMTKYERAMLRSTVRTVVCIPIFSSALEWMKRPEDRGDAVAVLAIDSDELVTVPFNNAAIRRMIAKSSLVLYGAVNRGIV